MKVATVVLSAVILFAIGPTHAARAQSAAADQGIDAVEVIKATATVQSIDLDKRKVTLLLDNGKKKTYKVDKSVQNLAQVKIGDHLNISFTEEIAIVVGKSGETPGAVSAGEVGVAPRGAEPGIVMVETSAMSAKILAVDAAKHRVTLADPDAKRRTIKVGKNVDLTQLSAGESVDMLVTESVVVDIVK